MRGEVGKREGGGGGGGVGEQTAVHTMQRGVFTRGPFQTKKAHFSGSCYLAPSGPLRRGKCIRPDLVCFACFWRICNYERQGAGHQARPLPLFRSSFFPRSFVEPPPPLSSYLLGCAASRLAVLSRASFHRSPSSNCRSIVASKIELLEKKKKGFVD